jgi:hypothetical protein
MRQTFALAAICGCLSLPVRADQPPEPGHKAHPLSVTGQALDPHGMPLPGATIYLVSRGGSPKLLGRAITDARGEYAFQNIPLPIPAPRSRAYFEYGSFRIFGRAPGLACAWRATKHLYLDPRFQFDATAHDCGYFPGEKIALDLKFEKPYPVTGKIVDEDGGPIAGAKVAMTSCIFCDGQGPEARPTVSDYLAWHEGNTFLPEDFVTSSGADGKFGLNAIPPDVFCGLIVEHPDYTGGLVRVATTEHPPQREREFPARPLPVELTLRRRYAVPVHVQSADTGRPAAGILVVAGAKPIDRYADSDRRTTDAEGNVILRVPRGAYTLEAIPPAESGSISSAQELKVDGRPPGAAVKFALSRGARLTFPVQLQAGASLPESDEPTQESHEPVAIQGRIIYDGPLSPPRLIGGIGNGERRGPAIFDESVQVDPESRGLANVVVSLSRMPAGLAIPPVPGKHVTLWAADRRFAPRVSILRTGQICFFTNKDPEPTNVHMDPARNPGVNRFVGANGDSFSWVFTKAEKAPVEIKSDPFVAMRAYQVVTNHPWVAVSDATGEFTLRGLPAGTYQLQVWHESSGWLERNLTVEVIAGKATDLTLVFPAKKFGR